MAEIVGTIYAGLGEGWSAIGHITEPYPVAFTRSTGEDEPLPRTVEMGPYEINTRMTPEAAAWLLAAMWQPGDPLYVPGRGPDGGVTRQMVQVIDDLDTGHLRSMDWPRGSHDVIERYGAARRAEPGPWSWLQPGPVRHG